MFHPCVVSRKTDLIDIMRAQPNETLTYHQDVEKKNSFSSWTHAIPSSKFPIDKFHTTKLLEYILFRKKCIDIEFSMDEWTAVNKSFHNLYAYLLWSIYWCLTSFRARRIRNPHLVLCALLQWRQAFINIIIPCYRPPQSFAYL